jgi:outer membrane receptor for ferric coprogen and ferric-rhodotorulic acid
MRNRLLNCKTREGIMKAHQHIQSLHTRLLCAVAMAACGAACGIAPAHAQETAADKASDTASAEEIVVTALKSGSVRLDKVPLAIQAFSGDTLKQRNVRDGADLIQLIPGASQAQEIGAGYRIFSFRGSGAGGPIGDGLIGYYLDDTPFGVPNNQAAPPVQYFDIDRVEVLRGPQGTFTGLARRPARSSTTPRIPISRRSPTRASWSFRARAKQAIPTTAGRRLFRSAGPRQARAAHQRWL